MSISFTGLDVLIEIHVLGRDRLPTIHSTLRPHGVSERDPRLVVQMEK